MTAKRFVKLLMALGYDRNYANDLRNLCTGYKSARDCMKWLFSKSYADLYAGIRAEVEMGGVKNG